MGLIGYTVAVFSHKYFGYLSYIYLLFLLYPLYNIKYHNIKDIIPKIISGIFLFTIMLILQSLVFDGKLSGKIGNMIIEELNPYIGTAGIWIFVLIGMGIGTLVFFEENKEFIIMQVKD